MSKLLKKERIVAKSVSNAPTKSGTKAGKRRTIFSNHSEQENNSTAVIAKDESQSTNDEDIFVSPVLSSFKVKMKVRMNGRINPIPVDDEDIVFLDE